MNCLHCATVLSISSKVPFKDPLNNERCYGCGILIKSVEEFYYCPSHKEYMVCNECRLCKKAHFMQKVRYLNKINSLYFNNSYGCDICSKNKEVTDNGIWHCTACNYDVCDECLP